MCFNKNEAKETNHPKNVSFTSIKNVISNHDENLS